MWAQTLLPHETFRWNVQINLCTTSTDQTSLRDDYECNYRPVGTFGW